MVAYDYGIKHNILRRLAAFGCRLTVVPADYPAQKVLEMNPDGIFLSNGPVRAALAVGAARQAVQVASLAWLLSHDDDGGRSAERGGQSASRDSPRRAGHTAPSSQAALAASKESADEQGLAVTRRRLESRAINRACSRWGPAACRATRARCRTR